MDHGTFTFGAFGRESLNREPYFAALHEEPLKCEPPHQKTLQKELTLYTFTSDAMMLGAFRSATFTLGLWEVLGLCPIPFVVFCAL